jgi:LacI family transcriptional regulator
LYLYRYKFIVKHAVLFRVLNRHTNGANRTWTVNRRRKPPTLADVAAKAAVSAQTVSNYLTGRNSPRPATLERLKSAIEELNYHPSAAARALRSDRSNIVGLILGDPEAPVGDSVGRGLREPLHAAFLHGAATKAYELKFYITTVLSCSGETEADALRLVREGRADGLIFSSEAVDNRRRHEIQKIAQQERVPVVLLQERTKITGIHTVAAEDEVGARLAAEHLINLGHRRLAIVGTKHPWPGPIRRSRAFLKAVSEAGLQAEEWLAETYSIDAVRARVADEFRREGRPTAIFSVNDIVAIAVIQQAMESGLQVPRDISVVGFNDLDIASYFRPAITTVRIPAVAMGARAVEILVESIQGKSPPTAQLLPVEFIARESTSHPPTSIRQLHQ